MGKPVEKSGTTKLERPPLSSFLQLLVDPAQDVSLKRLLVSYRDLETQRLLIRHLQGIRYNHRLNMMTAKGVSKARAWFKKRDRWCKEVSNLDKKLEKLLISFRDTIYPLLRASDKLSENYDREVDHIFEAIKQLESAIKSSSILSEKFTTRGHQAQPYLKAGVTALRRLKITEADAKEFLTLIGVKPDFSA